MLTSFRLVMHSRWKLLNFYQDYFLIISTLCCSYPNNCFVRKWPKYWFKISFLKIMDAYFTKLIFQIRSKFHVSQILLCFNLLTHYGVTNMLTYKWLIKFCVYFLQWIICDWNHCVQLCAEAKLLTTDSFMSEFIFSTRTFYKGVPDLANICPGRLCAMD